MKQVIVLEAHEVALLQRGKGLELAVGGMSVLLRFDSNGSGNAIGNALAAMTCAKCGKVLKNSQGLAMHMARTHKGKG